jgi:hypothetical protein
MLISMALRELALDGCMPPNTIHLLDLTFGLTSVADAFLHWMILHYFNISPIFRRIMILLTVHSFLAALQLNCSVFPRSHATPRQRADFVTTPPNASRIDCPSSQDHWQPAVSRRSAPSSAPSARPGHCRSSRKAAGTFQEERLLSCELWTYFFLQLQRSHRNDSSSSLTCLYNAGSPWDFLSSTTYKEGPSSNTWDHKQHATSF